MQTITIPIGFGPSDLGHLVDQVQSGIQVILTCHEEPKAVLSAYHPAGKPCRVATPDDPKLHGDLQSPVMEDWQLGLSHPPFPFRLSCQYQELTFKNACGTGPEQAAKENHHRKPHR